MIQEVKELKEAVPDNWPETLLTIISSIVTWYIGYRNRRKKQTPITINRRTQ